MLEHLTSPFSGFSSRVEPLCRKLFEADFYLAQLVGTQDAAAMSDVQQAAQADPIGHFLTEGWQLGLSPCRWFDPLGYLAANTAVAQMRINPFLHYLETGIEGEQRPMPFYIDRPVAHPELVRLGRSEYGPIRHILKLEAQTEEPAFTDSLAVHIHVFYEEMLDELIRLLKRLPCEFVLLVSTREDADIAAMQSKLEALLPAAGQVIIRPTPNRGRDMAPWLVLFREEIRRSSLFLHLHGKKSLHNGYHKGWFEFLGHSLLGSAYVAQQMLGLFARDSDLGMVAPGYWPMLRRAPNYGKARDLCRHLAARIGITLPELCTDFPAGGFFCCRSAILEPLLDLDLDFKDFPVEEGQICGTLAHAIERFLGLMPSLYAQKFEMVAVDVPFDQARQQRKETGLVKPLEPMADNIPSISVICAVSEWRDDLPEVLHSALDQIPAPKEVILADISKDTRVLIEVMTHFDSQLCSGRLRLVAPWGVTQADAYNIGLDEAEGEVLTYLTETRKWSPGYLAQLASIFENSPDVSSIYSNLTEPDTGPYSAIERLRILGAQRPMMLSQNLIDLSIFAHRRHLTDTGLRFTPELEDAAPWDFVLRATAKQAPLHLNHAFCASLASAQVPKRTHVHFRHRIERTYWRQDSLQIALKIAAPRPAYKHRWGDLHLAESLAKALDRLGCRTRVDILPDWYNHHPEDDAVIALRGVTPYDPDPRHINLMWHISHPARVSLDEMRRYDHVCVSAYPEAARVIEHLGVQASVMLQCADPERFHPDVDLTGVPQHDLLFVGNSRKTARWMPQACVDQGLPIAIYGAEWEGLIPLEYVKGSHVPNTRLPAYYRAAKIVLNDHWADMADRGFVSNRIMDAGMAGAMVISDHFAGEEALMGQVVTCSTPAEVKEAVEYYLSHEEERERQAAALHGLAILHHRVDQRAKQVLKTIRGLLEDRLMGRQ